MRARTPATLVRAEGLEPPQAIAHQDLNLARLPFPPRPRVRIFAYLISGCDGYDVLASLPSGGCVSYDLRFIARHVIGISAMPPTRIPIATKPDHVPHS